MSSSTQENEDKIKNLQEITGLDFVSCESLLSAAYGDVETAMMLFFERQEGGGEGEAADVTPTSALGKGQLVFGSQQTVPPASWSEQGVVSIKGTMNMLQKKNGPCGVLACLLAQIAVIRLEGRAHEGRMDVEITTSEIKQAIFRILSRCCSSKKKRVSFNGRTVKSVNELTDDEVSKPGCLITLIQSIVETKGEEEIKREVTNAKGELPLIVGPHSLCSSELMSLLIRGKANGNLSAINPQTGKPVDDKEWTIADTSIEAGFGLLSRPTDLIPIANSLKYPKFVR